VPALGGWSDDGGHFEEKTLIGISDNIARGRTKNANPVIAIAALQRASSLLLSCNSMGNSVKIKLKDREMTICPRNLQIQDARKSSKQHKKLATPARIRPSIQFISGYLRLA
jgi:hypothetical protein